MDPHNKDRLMNMVIDAVVVTMCAANGDIEDRCEAARREYPGLPEHVLLEARMIVLDEIEAPFWEAMAARLKFKPAPPPAKPDRSPILLGQKGSHIDADIPF